jgi:hypothetical protein
MFSFQLTNYIMIVINYVTAFCMAVVRCPLLPRRSTGFATYVTMLYYVVQNRNYLKHSDQNKQSYASWVFQSTVNLQTH